MNRWFIKSVEFGHAAALHGDGPPVHPTVLPRWGLLKRSSSNLHLAEGPSSIPPSSNASRGRFSGASLEARDGPPTPTAASSSAQDIPPTRITQDPSLLIAPTPIPEPNHYQSSNSGSIAKTEAPPAIELVTETLAHAQTGVAGISPI
ncbi:hypothetical protein DEU56DRAFT_915317 [Suillus clintonianus]|uniref:uncharacterized protein n=1 Tax=Suillus clintonianus TaxID=1904413 RepID=UPI001B881D39|nr:uncharacterized protein DEU56DRAFT_915317 [Suillus clintonianus]KAG2128998.1 hypothetical protein DEU56DRAFT_915317 [Suillus clintonianus]